MRIRRMASAAAPKKWPRPFQCWGLSASTSRLAASAPPATASAPLSTRYPGARETAPRTAAWSSSAKSSATHGPAERASGLRTQVVLGEENEALALQRLGGHLEVFDVQRQ